MSTRKERRADSPLDMKSKHLAVLEEKERERKKKGHEERAINPKMTAVIQCVTSVNYLCYMMLCKTSCCINIL